MKNVDYQNQQLDHLGIIGLITGQTIIYITPLSELQRNILLLLEFPVDLYERLSCNLLN